MAGKIRGLDQISAWFGGILAAAGVMTAVWYGSKFYVNKVDEEKAAEIAATIREIETSNKNNTDLEIDHPHSKNSELAEHSAPSKTDPKSPSALENYGYSGHLAPWYWANLNEKWSHCGAATGQSPIDLSGARLDERLKSLKFFYQYGVTSLSFEHQTVTGRVERGSYLEWEGERFDLQKVYVRTPSEHRANSLPFEMEVQLEHSSIDDKKFMVAVLFSPGKTIDLLERAIQNIPTIPGDTRELERANWSEVFPRKKTYWTYVGSSTIPPCDQGVRWIVFTDDASVGKSVIDHLVLKQKANARPVFSLGKRSLTRSNR
jgi:carbonic anhydrase